jgi:multidrug efflux system membrane fusion protein
VERSFTDREEFSGRLEASEFVELRPRVSGTVEQVHFADGALVARGDRLFTIDPRPFAAEVARLESLLAVAKNRAELAGSELARAQRLMDANAISRQEFDQLTSASRTSGNDIQSAEASLRNAKLNLEFTTVRAPINGRVSRTNVTAGNLVGDQVVLTLLGVSLRKAFQSKLVNPWWWTTVAEPMVAWAWKHCCARLQTVTTFCWCLPL